MRLETIRMNAAAADDATIGVNAMLAALPLDGSDTRPPNVTIYNQVDHPWVARRAINLPGDAVTFPALAILAQPSTVHQVMTSVRDAEIPIVFAYLVKADTAVNQRHASYTTRALMRFLRLFTDNAGASFRARNGVQLINPMDDVRQGESIQPWDKALAIAATEITWLARETQA